MTITPFSNASVLIESDWNLKNALLYALLYVGNIVLIESDWNLKEKDVSPEGADRLCINRIRLEFKVEIPCSVPHSFWY